MITSDKMQKLVDTTFGVASMIFLHPEIFSGMSHVERMEWVAR
jgi:hypothetical protein